MFSWDCSAAHADGLVCFMEKMRKFYGVPAKFSWQETGVGIISLNHNDVFYLILNDCMVRKLRAMNENGEISEHSAVRTAEDARQKFAIYGIPNHFYVKPAKLKNIQNTRFEQFLDSNSSVELDLASLESQIKSDTSQGLVPLMMTYTVRDHSTSLHEFPLVEKICKSYGNSPQNPSNKNLRNLPIRQRD
jgi:hypothetical protein